MKKLLALIILVLPMIAAAGPEDYNPVALYTAVNPMAVPYYLVTIPVDVVGLSDDEKTVLLEGRYTGFSGDYQVVDSSRHNEDIVTYIAKKEIFNRKQQGCALSEKAVATVRARNHISFGMSARDLEISVEYTSTQDSCHAAPTTQVIQYELAADAD